MDPRIVHRIAEILGEVVETDRFLVVKNVGHCSIKSVARLDTTWHLRVTTKTTKHLRLRVTTKLIR